MPWDGDVGSRPDQSAQPFTLPVALALGATQAEKGTSSGSLSTFLGEGAGDKGKPL